MEFRHIIKEGLTFFEKSVILSWNRYHQTKNTMSDDIKRETPETAPKLVPAYYSKSHFHRVIHADGVYGGSTPTVGNIIMHIWSHRLPLPEQTFNDANGNEVVEKRVLKPGIEREVEASVVINLELAKSLRDWLDSRIKHVEEMTQKAGK
jgi:hypothetical protein